MVRVRAPGKINLFLGVGSLRRDGYHDLVTVFHAVDLVDEVAALPSPRLELAVRGDAAADVPLDGRNLAWQAAILLAEHAQVAPRVRLEITKAIPVAGGMAGGSADAAATLVACARLWRTGTTREELVTLAARLGSDVAFPLAGGTAIGTGRGELLSPMRSSERFHWVVAFADHGISSADAYRELDRQRGVSSLAAPPSELLDAIRTGDPYRLAPTLANDLQDAALVLSPSLHDTLAAGRDRGALAGIVSGSGPTCAFLAPDAAAATVLAEALAGDGVCRDARAVSGPATGARVLP